jgi:aspartate/methionine/tyrosine aminotransferase
VESYEIGIENGAHQTIADADHPGQGQCLESGGERVIGNSAEMAAYLLNEANVALVPGGDFGHDDHIRISYATSMEQIEKGVERIRQALLNLR